ncbi:MAG: MerR family transcriptional regulator [Candidatus Gastranaerophilales bacterium]|nr:MerR family transcriptional regulator [Candidatus Gastranaerophilales bacterium]
MATRTKTKNAAGMIDANAPIFSISIIAEMLEVHQRTLRIYDEAKLLVPQRTPKNRRLYSMEDVERGKFIQYLTRELGINLAGVRIIFNLLEQLKVSSSDYIKHVKKVALSLNISLEDQENKKKMLLKRGRKPSVKATV